jgi:hypothetical protein
MIPNDIFLILNLISRLNDSITIMTSILREPLIHIIVGMGQVIQVIIHPRRALLIFPYE